MQLFYVPNLSIGLQALPPEEARHIVQVLRHREGDVLDLVDGQGGWYQGTIVAADKRSCQVQVVQLRQEAARAGQRLTLAVAPPKSNERLAWLLEKATEIGVDTIVPLLCQLSERRQLRLDRLEKVLVAAMKQSLQAWLPELKPLMPIAALLNSEAVQQAQGYIAWCEDEPDKSMLHDNLLPGQDVCILIGPEGDFSPEEVAAARQAGYQTVSLGPNRLRTETAAIAAVHTVALGSRVSPN